MAGAVRWVSGARLEDVDGGWVLVVSDGEPSSIDAVSATVAELVDGERDAAQIAALAVERSRGAITREQAWTALDLLADLGGLQERATPPSGAERISRRQLLGRAAVGGAAVIVLPIAAAGQAAAAGGNQERRTKQQAKEQARKQANEQRSKGSQEQKLKQGQEAQEKKSKNGEAKKKSG